MASQEKTRSILLLESSFESMLKNLRMISVVKGWLTGSAWSDGNVGREETIVGATKRTGYTVAEEVHIVRLKICMVGRTLFSPYRNT